MITQKDNIVKDYYILDGGSNIKTSLHFPQNHPRETCFAFHRAGRISPPERDFEAFSDEEREKMA